jgi:hypothetical protein
LGDHPHRLFFLLPPDDTKLDRILVIESVPEERDNVPKFCWNFCEVKILDEGRINSCCQVTSTKWDSGSFIQQKRERMCTSTSQRDHLLTSFSPLVVQYKCRSEDLYQYPEAVITMDHLIREAWEVVARDLPDFELADLYDWIERDLNRIRMHSMALYVIRGKDTGIEKINGWLTERALQYGFRLPTHEKMMNMVIIRTAKRAKLLLQEQEKANRKSSFVSSRPEAKPYKDKPDRVDLKQVPKKQQPLPETYVKPQITPTGNLRVLTKETKPGK